MTGETNSPTAPPERSRDRDIRGRAWFLATFNVALLAWLVVRPASASVQVAVDNFAYAAGPLIGFLWCLPRPRRVAPLVAGAAAPPVAARHAHRVAPSLAGARRNLPWVLFALASLFYGVGQAIWGYYEVVLGQKCPFPSWADAGYLAAYPCLFAGVMMLPLRPLPAVLRGRVLVDSLMVMTAVVTFSWYFLLGPVMLGGGETWVAKALGAAYPIAGLVLLFCVVVLSAQRGGDARLRRVVRLLSAGLAAVVVADTAFAFGTLRGTYATGWLTDLGWTLGYMLVGLAARELRLVTVAAAVAARPQATRPGGAAPGDAATPPGAAPDHAAHDLAAAAAATDAGPADADGPALPSLPVLLLPYGLVPAVAALLIFVRTRPVTDPLTAGVYAGSAALIGLVVLRQVLAILENRTLNRDLRASRDRAEADRRSLAAAHATLGQSEERFRIVAASATDLVYEWHVDGDRLEWFGDIDAHLGYPPGGFPHTLSAWVAAIHPDDRARVAAELASRAAAGAPFACEYQVATAGGAYLRWLDRGSFVRGGPGGAVSRMVGAVTDVTARHRSAALEAERAALRQAVAAMEQVLGVVGHELRTPLAGLRAMSEFLLTEGARQTEDADGMIRSMGEEVVRMAQTVNDLLEAARINSGLARWSWSRFDLGSACDEALDSVRPLVNATRVALRCEVGPGGAEMSGDGEAVRRLVLNLLSNAAKHTADGEIRVRVRVSGARAGDASGSGEADARDGDGGEGDAAWAEVEVSDTGSGIAPEVAARLGEPFALNAGIVGDRHVSGTGLGVAICKGIVAAHGGTLAVSSDPGRGTTVRVRLRADLPDAVSGGAKTCYVPAGAGDDGASSDA